MLSYQECLNSLESLVFRRGIDYSLETFVEVLSALEDPHLSLPKVVHIAGTNGKGSTVALLDAALSSSGYSVGTFTSPHLVSYCERIRLRGQSISESDFASVFNEVAPLIQRFEHLTEFEVLCAMAFLVFSRSDLDVVILETGLGGRLDATNVVRPDVCAVTRIGWDHMGILGDTLEAITGEKAGIIKPEVPVVVGTQPHKEVYRVLMRRILDSGAYGYFVGPVEELPSSCGLRGDFQRENVGIALGVLRVLFDEGLPDTIASGFGQAVHPGRYQIVEKDGQTIVVDAGHNEDGLLALKWVIEQDFKGRSITVLTGILSRKDGEAMAKVLDGVADRLLYCEFQEDAFSLEAFSSWVDHDVDAFHLGDPLPQEDVLVITGSLFFISHFSSLLD